MPDNYPTIGDHPLAQALMRFSSNPQQAPAIGSTNPFDGQVQPVLTQNPPGSNPFVMDFYRRMQGPVGQQMSPQQRSEAEAEFYRQMMTR